MFRAFAGLKHPSARFARRFLHQRPAAASQPPHPHSDAPAKPLSIRRALQRLVTALKVTAAAHLVSTQFLFPVGVGGPSMLPTLDVFGNWVLVDYRCRHGRNVQVGDLVGYDIPVSREDWGLKRVLGMPGDYVVLHPDGSVPEKNNPMIQVPEGHCWLTGDNLAVSRDSRFFGPVPLALIRGKCVARVLPLRSAQWFDNGLKPVE